MIAVHEPAAAALLIGSNGRQYMGRIKTFVAALAAIVAVVAGACSSAREAQPAQAPVYVGAVVVNSRDATGAGVKADGPTGATGSAAATTTTETTADVPVSGVPLPGVAKPPAAAPAGGAK